MFTTIYLKTWTKRGEKRPRTEGRQYTTKSLSPMHAHIRARHPEAQTWEGCKRVITDFIVGINLGVLPIVCGGKRIA